MPFTQSRGRSMVRDALLMLSTDQPPDPLEEIRWHAEHSANGEKTAMVTTRVLSGMTRGKSIVAFYGNAALTNRLLGYGTFAGYARLTTQRGRELFAASELYKGANHPKGLKGVIELTDVRLAGAADTVDLLNGIIAGGFVPLSLATIPEGPARLLIYFSRSPAKNAWGDNRK
jgi:hypothetical protein